MVVVTIELETAEDEARLLELLPTVHGRVVAKEDLSQSSEELATRQERLKNAISRLVGNRTAEKFGDASEWQRDVRGWDRVLDGRAE